MSGEPSMVQLAERLLARTQAGRQHWIVNTSTPGTFQTTAENLAFTIRSLDDDGNHPFTLTLWRKTQKPGKATDEKSSVYEKVEALNTLEGASLTGALSTAAAPYPTGWESTVAKLWVSARNDALKVTDSINAALSALDDDENAR
jgi:hypothetical protein